MKEPSPVMWYGRRFFALALALLSIPVYFYYLDIISRFTQKTLNLEVDPSYTGGRVAATMYDPVGDDYGFGALTYPTNREFLPGSLDLVRCVVHEPVYDAKWANLSDYWQLDLAFAGGTQAVRNIRVYIDLDGTATGSAYPRDDQAECVSFDPAHPWEWVVAISGMSGEIIASDGSARLPVKLTVLDGGKKVTVRIPLDNRRLHSVYEAKESALYVVVGGYSPWSSDGYLSVAKRPSPGVGGGAVSSLTPKIYDWLTPDGVAQETVLSSWNDETLESPSLVPIIVPMQSLSSSRTVSADSVFVVKMETLANAEASAERDARRTAWEEAKAQGKPASGNIDGLVEYGRLAFRAGENGEALAVFDEVLAAAPDSVPALAYKGAVIAMSAKDSSPLAAVDIVAHAYVFLDRAVSIARTSDDIITARTSRSNVSASVPDAVFSKALSGAEDNLVMARVYKDDASQDHPYMHEISGCYLNAGLCYETAGKGEDAGLWFRESARIESALPEGSESAWIKLALARRGLLSR